MITENIATIRTRVAAACGRAGRAPDSVRVICVSKGRSAAETARAVAAGLYDLGENRVREASLKYGELGSASTGVRWHFIGHLQTNKAAEAVRIFDLIHSVDSTRLAGEINTRAGKIGKIQEVLIEVNVSGEQTKYGVPPGAMTDDLIEYIDGLKHLRLRGLMTMAPAASDPGAARPYFRKLREMLVSVNSRRLDREPLRALSMGMSDDFETAIEEGATMVRLGRAIFGG